MPIVPAESHSICPASPFSSTSFLKTASADGDRQMLPMQTNKTVVFEFGLMGPGRLEVDERRILNHEWGSRISFIIRWESIKMNRILFENKATEYRLDPQDQRFEHVRGVLRMGTGDVFDVGVVNGPTGKATITALTADALQIEVEWGDRPPLPPPVHLLVGLCRPATARKILTTAPTLGIRSLVFTSTGRSDPAYGKASLWTGDEWRSRIREGVEQAFDTYVPPVQLTDTLTEALQVLPQEGRRLMLDVYEGTQALTSIDLDPAKPVCLAIGPERGWNKNDRNELRENGFELVSLNERVLRVETAVTVGLTLLLARLGVY